MDFTDNLLGEVWYWAAWAAWVPIFARMLWRADWARLKDAEQLNLWLGMIVLLTLVWSMKAGVQPGLTMHLLGANLFSLCLGPELAFIGLNLALLGVTLNGGAGGLSFAANALLLAGCGVGLSRLFWRLAVRLLPRHFFVYIFVNGFFGAAFSVIGVGAVASFVLAAAGVYAGDFLLSEYFPYFILLAFSEAWLSGMLLTLFVVYRPIWVATFEDEHYLRRK